MSTPVIFLCNGEINITHSIWHWIDLQFPVKDFVSQNTLYGHEQRHFYVTYISSKQAMYGIHFLYLLVIFNFLHIFYPNRLHYLLEKAWIVIIYIVNSVLSMTLRHCWFNILFSTLDAYLKMQFWYRGQSCFNWEDHEDKHDYLSVLIFVSGDCVTYVKGSWRFTL